NLYTQAYANIRKTLLSGGSTESVGALQSKIAKLQARLDDMNNAEQKARDRVTQAVGNPTEQAQLSTLYSDLQEQDTPERTVLNTGLGQEESRLNLPEISNLLSPSSAGSDITILPSAGLPHTPISPKPLRDAVVAAMAGLLIGITIAYTREQTEDHVRGRL